MPRKTHSILGLILTIILSLIITTQPAFATQDNVEELYFEDYTVDYYLSRTEDGISKMHVVEEFDAVFLIPDHNRGIVRLIPNTNQAGNNLTIPNLKFLDFQAWRNNEPVSVTIEEPKPDVAQSEYFIRIADTQYVYGKHHYRLEYNFERVITQQSGWQELYWDTNGTGWEQKFEHVTARLHIEDQELYDKMTGESWCYVGLEGENDQNRCKITRTDYGWEFQATDLLPHENLTFVVNFEPTTFTQTSTETEYWPFFLATTLPIIWILLAIYVFKHNYHKYEDRKYKKSLSTPVQYLPPPGYTVAESDFCYREGQECRSQVATLIELAVQDKIELIHVTGHEKESWKIKVKSTDLQEWQNLAIQAFKVDNSPLAVNDEIEIKFVNTEDRLFLLGVAYLTAVRNSVKQRGLAKIKLTRLTLRRIVLLICSVLIFIGMFTIGKEYLMKLADINASKPYTYASFYGGFLAAAFATIFLVFTPFYLFLLSFACKRGSKTTLTNRGVDLNNYLKGLDEYIKLAEKDRLNFLQSASTAETNHQNIVRLYEKVLPYAIIFHHEKTWFKVLGEYYTYADVSEPDWYMDDEDSLTSLANFVESATDYVVRVDLQKHKKRKRKEHSSGEATNEDSSHSRESYGTSTSSTSSNSSGSHGQGYSGGGGGGGGGGAC